MTAVDRTSTSTVAQLRLAADVLADHDLPAAYVTCYSSGTIEICWYLYINGKDQAGNAHKILQALGGTWNKSAQGDDRFCFDQVVRDGIVKLHVSVARDEVCERVVVGTEDLVVPASPAVEAQPERVETREVVEWRCGSLLEAATNGEQVTA